MTSKVYFLPWEKRERFGEWIAGTGAFDHVEPRRFMGLKIHFGEQGNTGYIKPGTVRPLVDRILEKGGWPFLTDANTIYVGKRADAYHHAITAAEHGFTLENCGCPVIIADGLRGNSGADVEVNLKHFKSVSIANAVHYADALIFLSHFKGHEISGFGGALKNMGMGCGTRAGKYAMHDNIHPEVSPESCVGCGECVKWCGPGSLSLKDKRVTFDSSRCVGCGECILSCPREVFHIPWDEKTSSVQEKIVEYAYGAVKNKCHFSINVINHITKFCDCYPDSGPTLMGDIGIMASADPVALDQACADMVNSRFGRDFWRHIFPDIDWTVQLDYAEKLGLGTRKYELIEA